MSLKRRSPRAVAARPRCPRSPCRPETEIADVELPEGDLEEVAEEEEEVLEDASELGEDEDDVAEVIEKVDENEER